MEFKNITTQQNPPTLKEIEICERVLKWAAEAEFIQFDVNKCQTILSETTNILRWNIGAEMLRLPLAHPDE